MAVLTVPGARWPMVPPPPRPVVDDLCWAATAVVVFPTWHRSVARYRGTVTYPSWGGPRPDPREGFRERELYGDQSGRSPLLAHGQWALKVRVYGQNPKMRE